LTTIFNLLILKLSIVNRQLSIAQATRNSVTNSLKSVKRKIKYFSFLIATDFLQTTFNSIAKLLKHVKKNFNQKNIILVKFILVYVNLYLKFSELKKSDYFSHSL